MDEGPSFQRRLHCEEVITDPRGVRYFLRLGRTGIYRFTPFNGFVLPAVIHTWFRYLTNHTRTWTIQVRKGRLWSSVRPDLLCEEYPDRAAAAKRADAIATGLMSGELKLDQKI
jgi:hypothetical protein